MSVGTKWMKFAGVSMVMLFAQSGQAVQLACYIEWQDNDTKFMSYNIPGNATAENIEMFTDKLKELASSSPENQGKTLTAIHCVEEGEGFGDASLDRAYLNTPQ